MLTSASVPLPCPCCALRRFNLRAWIALCAIALLTVLALWMLRRPVLTATARAWTLEDPLSKADAIFVAGGGADVRPSAAARLYHEGYAPRILVASPPERPTTARGLQPDHGTVNREMLLADGVPAEAIEMIAAGARNSHEEALGLRSWMQTHGAHTALIPTEYVHTRRMHWLYAKLMEPNNLHAIIHAIRPLEYSEKDWWMHEEGVLSLHAELLKFAYYRLKY